MKYFLTVAILLINFQCSQKSHFEGVECISSDDYIVFKPCRELVYNMKFWDSNFNLISEDRVIMMVTGKPWEFQLDSKIEAVVKYEFDLNEVETIKQYNINEPIKDWSWITENRVGVMENKRRILMPLFSQNQYKFLNAVPYLDVKLPLESGKKWRGSGFNFREGWGDWSNTIVKDYYEIKSYESIELPNTTLDAWYVSSFTEAEFGNSTHDFWFHPELGFVKMIIKNYGGQTLQIELIEVIDN